MSDVNMNGELQTQKFQSKTFEFIYRPSNKSVDTNF